MAETPAPKKAVKRAVSATRKSTDKRVVGTAKSPRKVAAPKAYKPPTLPDVVKKTAGRPKKAQ